jgi:heterodisulfide reductase subunit D
MERVKEMSEVGNAEEIEILYWVGCAAAADKRIGSIAQSMVRVLNRAGVSFAVLGPEERCTGDPARRTGNEFHYDMLARANIETLDRYGITRIVTHCPHCLHTMGNDYPQLGGRYRVIHHTQFVRELIETGRLELQAPLEELVTFHDPCYLGRYNGVFEAPRQVLVQLTRRTIEMKRSRERSFCCGAGGGHAFFEDRAGGKVNENRAREALDTGASTLCTACPFCLSMMEDGIPGASPDSGMKVRDLVELVDELTTPRDSG